MKLTGKCKNDFIEFLLNTDCKYSLNIEEGQLVSDAFFECPLSMQYGVFVDFFYTVLIDVDKIMINHYKLMGGYSLKDNCRESAIEKSNQDYNAQ